MASRRGRPNATPLPLSSDNRTTAEQAIAGFSAVVACRRELQRGVWRAAAAVRAASAGVKDLSAIEELIDLVELAWRDVESKEQLSHEECLLVCGLAQFVADELRVDGKETAASAFVSSLGAELAEALAELDLFDERLVQYWQFDERRAGVTGLVESMTRPRDFARLVRVCETFVREGGLGDEGRRGLLEATGERTVPSDGTARHAYMVLLLMEVARSKGTTLAAAARQVLDACSNHRVIAHRNPAGAWTSQGHAARALVGVLVAEQGAPARGETWVRTHGGRVETLASDYQALGREAASKAGLRKNGG